MFMGNMLSFPCYYVIFLFQFESSVGHRRCRSSGGLRLVSCWFQCSVVASDRVACHFAVFHSPLHLINCHSCWLFHESTETWKLSIACKSVLMEILNGAWFCCVVLQSLYLNFKHFAVQHFNLNVYFINNTAYFFNRFCFLVFGK